MNLLLMTQGGCICLERTNMSEIQPKQIVVTVLRELSLCTSGRKNCPTSSQRCFCSDNKEYKSFIMPDSAGSFTVSPYDLAAANNRYIYTKVTAPEETTVNISINNPFDTINRLLKSQVLSYETFQVQVKQEAPGFR